MSSLLVYESVPRNAAALSRLAPVKLTEVRSLMQLKRAVQQDPAVVAMEITQPQNLPAASNLIHWIKHEQPQAPAVIAMPLQPMPHANLWLYEAGADAIFESMLDRELIRQLMRRAIVRAEKVGKAPDGGSFRDKVVASMPWRRFGS